MEYDDFVLQIQANGDALRSHVLASSAGEASEPLEPPSDEVLGGPPNISGPALYRSVFRGHVGIAYQQSRGAAQVIGKGLRLLLRFDLSQPGSARAAAWPWETLAEDSKHPLSLDPATPLARYLKIRRPVRRVRLVSPLRVLAVASDPRGCSPFPLDLESERRRLKALSDGLKLDIRFPDCPTFQSLEDNLRKSPPHVFHFMGHGRFDPQRNHGYLYFETSRSCKDEVSGEDLSRLLTATGTPPLAVLNACESAQTDNGSGEDPFSGVATELIQGGVPAVVAMRSPVGDSQATAFSHAFYQALAERQPIDAAVTAGRSAMYAADRTSNNWSIPVLFLRVQDGRLFQDEPEPTMPLPHLPSAPVYNDNSINIGKVEGETVNIGSKIYLGVGRRDLT